jgi:hypothetical protein
MRIFWRMLFLHTQVDILRLGTFGRHIGQPIRSTQTNVDIKIDTIVIQ